MPHRPIAALSHCPIATLPHCRIVRIEQLRPALAGRIEQFNHHTAPIPPLLTHHFAHPGPAIEPLSIEPLSHSIVELSHCPIAALSCHLRRPDILTPETAMRQTIKDITGVLRGAAKLLAANDPLRMAGATAFFTTFALPPILIIIVRTLGLFIDRRTIGRHVLNNLGRVIGNEGSMQILSVIRVIRDYRFNTLATLLITLFMLFVATTLFMVVKNSVNQLWRIRLAPGRKFRSILKSRLKAIGLILFTGVLFLAVMVIDLMQAYMGKYLYRISPILGDYVYGAVNHIVSFAVVTLWFFMLFRYLPDGKPKTKVALLGGAVTGLLFSVGKYILQWMLSGRIQELYGNSGALVLILLFVFYSAMILYYGAAFTRTWARYKGSGITPLPHAARYRISRPADEPQP